MKAGVALALMSEEDRRRRAREIAEARYGFRWHAAIYLVVNAALVGVWYWTGAGFPWPLFPIVFWGIGLLSHYIGAYRRPGRGWIDRETAKILAEEEQRQSP
jgi:hypothetical protein